MKAGNDDRRFFSRYLPYSKEDEKLGMACTSIGDIDTPPNTLYPPSKSTHPLIFRSVAEGRTLSEFQLVYISEGEGVFSIEGATYIVTPGSMLLLLPGMKQLYKPRLETGWHEYWVGFTGTFFRSLVAEKILSRERVFFKIGLRDYILSIFTRIFEEIRLQRPLFQMRACAQIFLLLTEILSDEHRRPSQNYLQKIVERVKYLMEANINQKTNITSIAHTIGISTSRLNEVFKMYTSMTPYHYNIHLKINRACHILEREDVSVKEAALSLGFKDQCYFSRLFKQKTGILPSKWKRHIYQ